MIQFYKEDLFQKTKIKKIATIILLTANGMFENGLRYQALSNRGQARNLDFDNASRNIATTLKSLMKEPAQHENPSLTNHGTNVTVMEDFIPYLVSKTYSPKISFASILHNFNDLPDDDIED